MTGWLGRRRSAVSPQRTLSTVTGNVRITDGLVSVIHDRIAVVPPERGGALLGFGGLAHLLVEDDVGTYSAASWDISAQLSSAVGQLESRGRGQLIGTVHSHPHGVMDPSTTDLRTTARTLEMNPHLASLLIGVVTRGEPRPSDVPVGESFRMSVHLMRQGPEDPHERVRRVPVDVIPLHEHLRQAEVTVNAATSTTRWLEPAEAPDLEDQSLSQVLRINGRERLIVDLDAENGAALFVDADHPGVGPLVIVPTGTGTGLQSRDSSWDPGAAAGPQLKNLANAAKTEPVKAGPSIEVDPAAKGDPMAEAEPATKAVPVPNALDRVTSLAGDLTSRRVLVVGLGSVGSVLCEALVRNGVREFTLVDPEAVEAPNLSRTVYTAADLGTAKVSAMAARLRAIDPAVRVSESRSEIGRSEVAALVNGMDLVVAATDDMLDQTVLSHHAYWAGVPLVACALYRQAAAGEVVLVVPTSGTACWNCAVGGGSASETMRPEKDYGLNGRLVAEVALGPAIHLVTNVAAMTAIGLLAEDGAPSRQRLGPLLKKGRTLGLVSTSPQWEFFPKLFAGMDHQFAPQSVWVQVTAREDCPVCGSDREAPPSSADGRELADLIAELGDDTVPQGSTHRP